MPTQRDNRCDQLDTRGILRPNAGYHQAIPAKPLCSFTPAALWGREAYIRGLLDDTVTNVKTERRQLEVKRFNSAEGVHNYFKNHYGPTIEAYTNIGDNSVLAAELDAQLTELAQKYLTNSTMGWEYLLLTAQKH